MITSDYNFVNVDFFIEYRVTDPVKYLYASAQPELILKTLAQSYIRDTIGLYPVDEVITTGRGRRLSQTAGRSAPCRGPSGNQRQIDDCCHRAL